MSRHVKLPGEPRRDGEGQRQTEAPQEWKSSTGSPGRLGGHVEQAQDLVDVQVLSLTDPGVQMQPDPGIAVADAQLVNDVLAAAVRDNPTRFDGLAAMPLQDPAAAVRELERAVTDLGLSVVLVNGHTLGSYLDEPQYHVLWEALSGTTSRSTHPDSAPLGWSVFDGRPELPAPPTPGPPRRVRTRCG